MEIDCGLSWGLVLWLTSAPTLSTPATANSGGTNHD